MVTASLPVGLHHAVHLGIEIFMSWGHCSMNTTKQVGQAISSQGREVESLSADYADQKKVTKAKVFSCDSA
jgi:hypothetical protein